MCCKIVPKLLDKLQSLAGDLLMKICPIYPMFQYHDDVIKWKHVPRYWSYVWGIHRSPVNSPHKGQWRGALMFSLICTRINGWVNNGEAGSFRRPRVHYDTVMYVTVWVTTHECGTSDNSIYYVLSCNSYDITQTSWETWRKYPGL